MSSSAYPIIWALKHAPVIDAIERAILLAIADHGDADGCDCYPSIPTLAKAALVDEATARRRRDGLAARGVIRRQEGPPPARWLKLPKHLRPVVWEVMIPFAWWSDAQREEINRMRAERGRPPLTPELRPNLAPAPPKPARSDKGKPAPNRGRKRAATEVPPVSERGGTDETGGVFKTGGGVSLRQGEGCLEDTQPSRCDLPVEPSLPPLRVSADEPGPTSGTEEGGREGTPEAETHLAAARALVDGLPPVGGRLLSTRNRPPLVEGIAARLAAGWTVTGLRAELTKNLHDAGSAGIYPHRLEALPVTPPRHRRAPAAPPPTAATPSTPHPWSAGADGACTECGATYPTSIHTGSAGPVRRCDHGRVIQACPSCRDTTARPADSPSDARTAPPEGDAMDARPSTLLANVGGSVRG